MSRKYCSKNIIVHSITDSSNNLL